MKDGKVQVYFGEGKGKTTASIGQAVRAMGRGLKVEIVQFLKNMVSGEHKYFEKNSENVNITIMNSLKKFYWEMTDDEKEKIREETQSGWENVKDIVKNEKCDILILDEIGWVINQKILDIALVLDLIDNKPDTVEIILTGRVMDERVLKRADLVSEIKKVKHPFDNGTKSRIGIEI